MKNTISQINLTNSPWINKPLNWLRRNAAGDPNIQRYLVSLEPVKKEFESFLLNQKALYADDRIVANKLLDETLSPKQIEAALNQMGKTARDRFRAMNQRYKRVMGEDVEFAFSPEAEDAAKQIGIELGIGGGAKGSRPPLGSFEGK